jgi:diguanylate cyclase (GGDEF)-like protein
MSQSPEPAVPEPSPAGGRAFRLRRWLLARGPIGEDRSAFAFGVRLVATVLLTFVVIAITSYVLLERNLAHRQITDYASAQRADGEAFEHEATRAVSTDDGIDDIEQFLDGVARRPGTREAFLVDRGGVIQAASNSALIGTHDIDAGLTAALEHGRSYAGRETDPNKHHRNFEFVIPVNLPSGRYAYEITYDHATYDAQLNEVRTILAAVWLLALLGGGAVFYLVGGRRLVRDHRMVLRRATRDGLTDLPNQRAFQDEFPQAVASASRYKEPLSLARLDIDDFKGINDRHGHPHGDSVLKRVAEVLHGTRPGDRPYRTGGDEFALMLSHTDARGARVLARRLSRLMAEAGISASIGVSALRPGLLADTLSAEADAALYEAKRQGGGRSAHFDDIRASVFVITSEKKEAVRRLIDERRLTTVFQPIWDLGGEALLGVEALTRPDVSYGLSGPAEAFDVAEQIGLVHQLDVLCVENALQYAPELEPGVLLFINLSPLTLELDAEADAWLAPAVERAGLRPQAVVVEVTERFGGRTASVVKRLKRLRHQGFKIALDDVGTGNAGLEMLRAIAAEFVKLDRSIVAAASTEPGARAVLMAMATFARQTGAFVIAEGIEDEDTLEFLLSIDDRQLISDTIIQGGQGYGLGRPAAELAPGLPAMLHRGDAPHPVAGPSDPLGGPSQTRDPISVAASAATRRGGWSRR